MNPLGVDFCGEGVQPMPRGFTFLCFVSMNTTLANIDEFELFYNKGLFRTCNRNTG